MRSAPGSARTRAYGRAWSARADPSRGTRMRSFMSSPFPFPRVSLGPDATADACSHRPNRHPRQLGLDRDLLVAEPVVVALQLGELVVRVPLGADHRVVGGLDRPDQ